MPEYKSVFERQISPFVQAGLIVSGAIVIMLIAKLLDFSGIMEMKSIFPWEMAFSGILFYALFNAIFSLSQKDQNTYFLHSVISFFLLVIVLALTAWLFSGMSIDEAGSFRWLLVIFTFSYLLIISIVRGMRKVVQLAQKQDAALRGEVEENE